MTSGKQAALCHERAKLSMLLGPPTWRMRENEEDLARTLEAIHDSVNPPNGGLSKPPSIPHSAQVFRIADRVPMTEVTRVVRV